MTDVFCPPLSNEDFIDRTVSTLRDILTGKGKCKRNPVKGHILIFMDSIPNIQLAQEKIEEMFSTQPDLEAADFKILQLHGLVAPEEQANAFKEYFVEEQSRYATKIIIANKIAESSVTIDQVTVVIDSGYTKEARYDPIRKISSVNTELISRAQAV